MKDIAAKKPVVSIVKRDQVPGSPGNYSERDLQVVYEMVDEAVKLAVGGIENVVFPGDKVLLKPNLLFPVDPDWGIATDARVVEAVVRLIKEKVKPVYVMVAEHCACGSNTAEAFKVSRVGEAAYRAGADDVFPFDQTGTVEVEIPRAKYWVKERPKVFLPVLEADCIINLPKMKTHYMASRTTLGVKNLNGIIPFGGMDKQQQGAHMEDLPQKFVDLYRVVRHKMRLTVMDGIIGMEGQGPCMGTTVQMNLIIAGSDCVAVDAVTAACMGFDPIREQPITRICQHEGLGVGDLSRIEVRGKKVEEVMRRFIRGEYDPAGVYPNVEVYGRASCIGCMTPVRGALDWLTKAGLDVTKAGRLVFIYGKGPVPDYIPDYIPSDDVSYFIVGDCVPEDVVEKFRAKGAFYYPGCAPVLGFSLIAADVEKLIKARG